MVDVSPALTALSTGLGEIGESMLCYAVAATVEGVYNQYEDSCTHYMRVAMSDGDVYLGIEYPLESTDSGYDIPEWFELDRPDRCGLTGSVANEWVSHVGVLVMVGNEEDEDLSDMAWSE